MRPLIYILLTNLLFLDGIAQAGTDPSNTFTLGDSTNGSNKSFRAKTGSGLRDFRYNPTTARWEFTNDGSAYSGVGTDGGSVASISGTDIDWAAASIQTKTLSANTTFTFSNVTSGRTIVVRLTNTASNYTVTWPTVTWSGGSAPVMTIGAKSDVYTFIYDGANIYGSVVQNMF